MKKLPLLAVLLLGSCTTPGVPTKDQIADIARQVQAYTAQACQAAPTLEAAITLLGAFYGGATPVISIVNAVGDAFCRAPVTAAVRRGAVIGQVRIVQTPRGPVAAKSVTRLPR